MEVGNDFENLALDAPWHRTLTAHATMSAILLNREDYKLDDDIYFHSIFFGEETFHHRYDITQREQRSHNCFFQFTGDELKIDVFRFKMVQVACRVMYRIFRCTEFRLHTHIVCFLLFSRGQANILNNERNSNCGTCFTVDHRICVVGKCH